MNTIQTRDARAGGRQCLGSLVEKIKEIQEPQATGLTIPIREAVRIEAQTVGDIGSEADNDTYC